MRTTFTLITSLVLSIALTACQSTPTTPEAVTQPDVASEQAEEAPAFKKVYQNAIKWSTASEVDNYGYYIYRGDSEEGPFVKLNERILAGAGTTDEPQKYAFIDDTIEMGVVYWYYVESVSMDGIREKFTPVFPSKAKTEEDAILVDPETGEKIETEAAE